jgi:hypothetical protein
MQKPSAEQFPDMTSQGVLSSVETTRQLCDLEPKGAIYLTDWAAANFDSLDYGQYLGSLAQHPEAEVVEHVIEQSKGIAEIWNRAGILQVAVCSEHEDVAMEALELGSAVPQYVDGNSTNYRANILRNAVRSEFEGVGLRAVELAVDIDGHNKMGFVLNQAVQSEHVSVVNFATQLLHI